MSTHEQELLKDALSRTAALRDKAVARELARIEAEEEKVMETVIRLSDNCFSSAPVKRNGDDVVFENEFNVSHIDPKYDIRDHAKEIADLKEGLVMQKMGEDTTSPLSDDYLRYITLWSSLEDTREKYSSFIPPDMVKDLIWEPEKHGATPSESLLEYRELQVKLEEFFYSGWRIVERVNKNDSSSISEGTVSEPTNEKEPSINFINNRSVFVPVITIRSEAKKNSITKVLLEISTIESRHFLKVKSAQTNKRKV